MADIKNSAVELIGNTTLADLVEEELLICKIV